MLLKALIFAAGMIGVGNWGQYARGRSEGGCKYFLKIIYHSCFISF